MKLMMKNWLLRPMALLLMVMLMVTEPASVLANEDASPIATEETAIAVEETSEVEEAVEDIAEEAPVVSDTEAVEESPSAEESPSESETPAESEAAKNYVLKIAKKSYVWTGSAIKPEVTLVDKESGDTIAFDPSACSYSSNVNVGTANVTVTFEGKKYSGTFTILPVKATGLKLTDITNCTMNASCNEISSAMKKGPKSWKYKWQLLRYDKESNKYKVVRTVRTEKNKYSFEKLSSATVYKVRVAYVAETKDGKILTGENSSLNKKCTRPAKVSLSSVGKTGASSMKVNWKTVNNATGYQICYSKTNDFKSAWKVKVKGAKADSKTVKDMKYTTCVYVRVRAYRNYDDHVVFGKWSNVKLSVPEAAGKVSFIKRTEDSLSVKCKAASSTDLKYQFKLFKYNSDSKKWVSVKSLRSSKNETTFTGLSAGLKYKVAVRYYKEVKDGTRSGEWSDKKLMATTPAKVVISQAVKKSGQKLKISWSPVSHGSGYEVQWSTKSDFSSNNKSVLVKNISKDSKTVDLGSSSEYYARVRAYVVLNDKKIYGPWSDKRFTSYSHVYASYTTTYASSNYNRSTNLRLACKAINGTVLQPGETFSFNGIVGERTAAKGYREAIIYEGGQEVGGIGGGICQVATTFFNAALKANFTINERHQHSMTVHYAPLGYDAAIAWGSKNLRFTNTSGVPIKIYSVASDGVLTVKFLSNIETNPPKVTTSVSVSNRVYTLKRYVNGKCNYTTTSKYLDV